MNIQWSQFKHKQGEEWAGPCPVCPDHGTDRFMVWKDRENYWCRKCGIKGFLDGETRKPTPDEVAELEARIKQRQEQETLLRDKAIKRLVDQAYWRGFHDCMDLPHRQYWLNEGIPNWALDYFDLGYCPSKVIIFEGQTFTYPAYTIPINEPVTHKIVNVQYRLVNAPPAVGKYRQEANLPAAAFFFDPDHDRGQRAMIVEGSKKAIVVGCTMDDHTMQFVGIPSNTPSEELIRAVSEYETVYVTLDPGAEKQARRVARIIGKRARMVSLPAKPDDLLTLYGGSADLIRRAMKESAPT